MSLTDDPPAWTAEPPEEYGDGPAPYQPGEAPTGGRTPPQDMAAEQSVLGAMLISKDAIADVVEVIRGVDYYRPAHEEIHEAILDLYSRGEPADMVTVAGELQRRGQLQQGQLQIGRQAAEPFSSTAAMPRSRRRHPTRWRPPWRKRSTSSFTFLPNPVADESNEPTGFPQGQDRSEEHTSELQSH